MSDDDDVMMDKWLEDFHASERIRVAALPVEFQKIHELVGYCGPTNYSVHFPWNHHLNEVPNCFAMLGDGSIIFKLEVIDKDTFKLAVNRFWRGEGDYDFLFFDHNIQIGDTLNYETLYKIIRKSVDHINARSECLTFPPVPKNLEI